VFHKDLLLLPVFPHCTPCIAPRRQADGDTFRHDDRASWIDTDIFLAQSFSLTPCSHSSRRSISPSQLGRLRRGGFDHDGPTSSVVVFSSLVFIRPILFMAARRSEFGLSELQKGDGEQEDARQYEARR
jgi:hypothetical protein